MFQFTYVFQASKELNLVIRKRAGLDLFPSESSGIYHFILFSFYMILRFFHSVLTKEKWLYILHLLSCKKISCLPFYFSHVFIFLYLSLFFSVIFFLSFHEKYFIIDGCQHKLFWSFNGSFVVQLYFLIGVRKNIRIFASLWPDPLNGPEMKMAAIQHAINIIIPMPA